MGIATSTAVVTIENNSSNTSYSFTIKGETSGGGTTPTDPCDGVMLMQNPISSAGTDLQVTVATSTQLSARIYTTMGTLVRTVRSPINVSAGTYSIYINPNGLTRGAVYILRVEKGNEACPIQFIVQ